MKQSDDLVSRLRRRSKGLGDPLCEEAADRINSLLDESERADRAEESLRQAISRLMAIRAIAERPMP